MSNISYSPACVRRLEIKHMRALALVQQDRPYRLQIACAIAIGIVTALVLL